MSRKHLAAFLVPPLNVFNVLRSLLVPRFKAGVELDGSAPFVARAKRLAIVIYINILQYVVIRLDKVTCSTATRNVRGGPSQNIPRLG